MSTHPHAGQSAASLPTDLCLFEARIRSVAAAHPDLPSNLVVLTKLLGHIALRTEQAYEQLMAPYALSFASWQAMMMVYARADDEVTPTELSKSLYLARANVTRVTDDLVRRGLLHREPSTRDRRVLRLSLTASGLDLVQQVLPRACDLHRAIWSQIAPARLPEVLDLLCGIAQGIESWPTPPSSVATAEQP